MSLGVENEVIDTVILNLEHVVLLHRINIISSMIEGLALTGA